MPHTPAAAAAGVPTRSPSLQMFPLLFLSLDAHNGVSTAGDKRSKTSGSSNKHFNSQKNTLHAAVKKIIRILPFIR